ncbi:MAG TPA: hypothetical protein VNO30_05845 [Kofleriaceae bacterium]|nr:hypothetical protein [Kofleriaceae bacterium]
MLRYRRLDLVLELSLLLLIALGLAGVLIVLFLEPLALLLTIAAAMLTGLALSYLLGEGTVGGLILGGVMSLLGLGLYALYLLLDLSLEWTAGLAGVVVLLFATVLVRALLATGEDPRP